MNRTITLIGSFLALALVTLSGLLTISSVQAVELPVLKITKINDKVYSAIGETLPPSYQNWGHNNNLSFVISNDGVLVVNGGANTALAKSLHNEIKKLTKQPVKWVVNENSQGHAALGNGYWASLGVDIIAHESAVKDFSESGHTALKRMLGINKERGKGTSVAVPNHSFKDTKDIQLGDIKVQLIRFGEAHSVGDISVWLPDEKIVIAGDIAFHERLLAVFPETVTEAWLESLDKMFALKPEVIIPGHGHPTDVATIKKYTYDYIAYLRSEVEKLLDEDIGLEEAYKIDQSAYSHMDTFNELATKNAGRVYQEMEMNSF